MPRTHGYARIGRRCYGKRDWHARGRINVIGASINMELVSVGLFDSYIDSDIFYQWTIKILLPSLKRSSVIVLDNASFHKRHDIQRAIIDAGHILIYLPPYSPDLNPSTNGLKLNPFGASYDVILTPFLPSMLVESIYRGLAILPEFFVPCRGYFSLQGTILLKKEITR